jgi:hypothetical protein
MTEGFYCHTCGAYHEELPRNFSADRPAQYWHVAEEERAARIDMTSDQCVIDEEHFFIRGNIEIPIVDGPGVLSWGVWVSLSEKNFLRASDLWETEGRETEPPYFGWLCTGVPCYPDTMLLKTHVHTQPVGTRPLIELEQTDHPLAVEQREGITMARLHEIVAEVTRDA